MSKYIRVGFTGTRQGLSGDQKHWLEQEMKLLDIMIRLQLMKEPVLHHGDCVGADAEAHAIGQGLGWRICVHPPLNATRRAFCEGASKTFRESGYLARNRRIISSTSITLAVPGTPLIESDAAKSFGLDPTVEAPLSGSWYTVLKSLEAGHETRVCSMPPW